MIKHHFKIAWRNLLSNKSHSLINILGLALSIACTIVIFQVIRHEQSFDTFHKNKDKIYRLFTQSNRNDVVEKTTGVPYPVFDALQNEFPAIEKMTIVEQYVPRQIAVTNGLDKRLYKVDQEEELFCYTSPLFFKIFDVKWKTGDASGTLGAPNNIIISETMAQKLFPGEQAIGKEIQIDNETFYTITGIAENPPLNSDFPFHLYASYKTVEDERKGLGWGNISSNVQCYAMIASPSEAEKIESGLPSFVKKHYGPDNSDGRAHYLQPLSDIHFNTELSNFNFRTVSKENLLAFMLIAVLLVITASINFVNLSTALAGKRAKEIGIRKYLGSLKRQLIYQFLSEVFLIVMAASCIAMLAVWLFSYRIVQIIGIEMQLSVFDGKMLWLLLLLVVVIVLLGGFYPAFVISGFKPIEAIAAKFSRQTTGGLNLRRSLVIVQFSISQLLIIGVLVMVWQMSYFKNGPYGIDKKAILSVNLPGNEAGNLQSVKNQLNNIPAVEKFSFCYSTPTSEYISITDFDYEGKQGGYLTHLKYGDENYINTYGIELLAGEELRDSDSLKRYIGNEAFARLLGYTDPKKAVGEYIRVEGNRALISGVVKDFNLVSFRHKVEPCLISINTNEYYMAGIKVHTENLGGTIDRIKEIWADVYPDHVFEYKFLDDTIASFYQEEARLSRLLKLFAGIAIFISCLGLYGLISFIATQRTKEIGIRKVMGATAFHVVYSFSKEFTVLILVAFLIAAPVGYFIMTKWLSNFAYKIDMGVGIFTIAIAGSILITWVTIGYQSAKAALTNPADVLKYE